MKKRITRLGDNAIRLGINAGVKLGLVEPAAPQVQIARQALCDTCPQYIAGRCRECGCLSANAIRVASKKCPLGKW